MAKPWARIEIGYLSHPKFLCLSGNAINLWHEGKQYCDMHYTDGLIPRGALKGFRFRGVTSVKQLLTSCGQKADGSPYAPLWEEHANGYRMHDYLDHNPCREEALARVNLVDAQRAARRDRMARWREAKSVTHHSDTSQAHHSDTLQEHHCNALQERYCNALIEENRIEENSTDPVSVGTSLKGRTDGAVALCATTPTSPPLLEFPTNGPLKSWRLSEAQVAAWATAYPQLNILDECRKALAWVEANQRKTARGMPAFLVRWLNKATDRGSRSTPKSAPTYAGWRPQAQP